MSSSRNPFWPTFTRHEDAVGIGIVNRRRADIPEVRGRPEPVDARPALRGPRTGPVGRQAKRKRAAKFPSPPSITQLSNYPITRLPLSLAPRLRNLRHERFIRLDEVLHVAFELELVVGRLDRRRRRRWFVRRDADLPVVLEARARRNEAAHRDVLLQAAPRSED